MGTYLGQNFLKDSKIQKLIADKVKEFSDIYKTKTIIEIGPGKGAITKRICDISPYFFVVETDEKMIKILQNFLKKEQIIHQSILDFPIDMFFQQQQLKKKQTIIVGNLPYYITSPILRMFFGQGLQDFSAGIFMVQKEVAEKIRHDANKKSFLRRLLNYSYEVTYLKTVPARAFSPAPKVDSAVIAITAKSQARIPKGAFDQFYRLLDSISGFKRKTLGKIQKILNKKAKDTIIIIPENLSKKRLEELTWNDMQTILLENHTHLRIVTKTKQ